ncbi:hypothetical protein vBPaeMUSP18_02 [Pseudomonas phage vB_PaeM_USP_18]|nr:hypothetical protein vBPaeMUSP18_02 [Pseudomonas phage vB_PaeM_USP_18]QLI49534.1 hypothetical protein vBPaeMUSP25_02 [Pseudomonas phage vB_PaeM_USP_25]
MHKARIKTERMLARKYKAMGLPVQRRAAVEYALFYRRLQQFN